MGRMMHGPVNGLAHNSRSRRSYQKQPFAGSDTVHLTGYRISYLRPTVRTSFGATIEAGPEMAFNS
jgi:hypothetical protein